MKYSSASPRPARAFLRAVATEYNSVGELIHFFFVQRIRGFDTPTAPSLDRETLGRLTKELGHASFYLEFGSGGSTLLADRMGVRGVSVEGDPYYGAVVQKALRGGTMTVIMPNIGITGPWSCPLLKRPTRRRIARWRGYIQAPFARIEHFPDLILVDGRFRVACSLQSARQAHASGCRATLILDDYTYRPLYHQVEEYLGKPEIVGRAAVFEIGHQVVPEIAVEDALRDPF